MFSFISSTAKRVGDGAQTKSCKKAGSSLWVTGVSVAFCLALTSCGGGSDGSAPVFGGGSGGSGGGSGTTTLKIGTGIQDDFVGGDIGLGVADILVGESTTLRVNLVDANNEPIVGGGYTITFSSDCYALGLAYFGSAPSDAPTASVNNSGLASTTYTDAGCASGGETVTDIITARLVVDNATIQATGTINVTSTVNPTSVQYQSTETDVISLKGVGGIETTQVTFKLVGSSGAPISGEQMELDLSNTIGGITLVGSNNVYPLIRETDSNGEVRVRVQSGTVAATTKVIATHSTSGLRAESEGIIVSTGLPVANRFSLSLSAFNPPNAFNTDGVEVSLSVIASDQFGNNVPDGTTISFWSPESGNIGSSCTIQEGACSVNWRSASPRPSDMRLTVIAYANGAEEFTDRNGNNIFDMGSEFNAAVDDLPEAYVDEDESGFYENVEKFVDTNNNNIYDGGNSEWDGPCLFEANDTTNRNAYCAGQESLVISSSAVITMPTNSARLLSAAPATGSTINLSGGAVTVSIVLADSNTAADSLGSNPMPLGTTVAFSTDNGEIVAGASSEVDNRTSPSTHQVLIAPDDTPSTGTLVLRVTAPDGTESAAFWTISD